MKRILPGLALVCLCPTLFLAQAFASARPIEGWGPFRLYQNLPRMQNPRFLPKYRLEGYSLDSYEERFEAGKMIRKYRCIDELPCERKKSVPVLLTLQIVDGRLLHASVETDFSQAAVAQVEPGAKPAVSAGEGSGSGGGRTQMESAATVGTAPEGEADKADWEARKALGNQTFIYQINYLFDRYLGKKPQNEDLQQFFDGDGPHYSSSIQSPGSEKEWIELSFYPESPLLTIEVNTREWDEMQSDEQAESAKVLSPLPTEKQKP